MWLSNIIVHRVFKNFDFRMTARVYDSLHNNRPYYCLFIANCHTCIFFWATASFKLLICVVDGHYANMQSTNSRPGYFARLQTPYMNMTDMCLELYYQLKTTGIVDRPMIRVFVIDEERKHPNYLASSTGENRTAWDRMFTKLPGGVYQIVIDSRGAIVRKLAPVCIGCLKQFFVIFCQFRVHLVPKTCLAFFLVIYHIWASIEMTSQCVKTCCYDAS